MKILFVCRANVVRSQMAAAWYNQLTGTKDADSAGTHVDEPGQTLGERRAKHPGASYAVDVMSDKHIDMSGSGRTQVTPEMLKQYDKVINMAAPQYTPEWLSRAPNYVFWDVLDPMGHSYEKTSEVRDIIQKKVEQLIRA
jgi:protein-tyrosine-phosphatase